MKNTLKHLLTLTLFLVAYNSSAQQTKSLSDFRVSSNDVDKLEKLIFDNLPTIYLKSGEINIKGESPKRIITDVDSWKSLLEIKQPETIEVIIVQFRQKTDLKQSLNLDLLQQFSSLDRVFISGHFSICDESKTDCELKQVESILKGSPKVDIIYNFQTIN